MNKLTALSKLANAYLTLSADRLAPTAGDEEALAVITDKFHYIRRSLRIEDLKPVPKPEAAEGLNPAGPKFF